MLLHICANNPRDRLSSSAFLVVLVGICDYLAGAEIGFSIFYIDPGSLATWLAGITGGLY
jgi:hypothetical protein